MLTKVRFAWGLIDLFQGIDQYEYGGPSKLLYYCDCFTEPPGLLWQWELLCPKCLNDKCIEVMAKRAHYK